MRTYLSSRELIKGAISFLITLLLLFAVSHYCRFLVSETDSLHQHFFLHFPTINPQKGDYTLIYSDWYQGKIIKKIIGNSGDVIWYDKEGFLWINQIKLGKPKQTTKDGVQLKAISAQTIPPGFIFLHSSHERSFDSRYQELGLVPLNKIKGLVVPLG